MQDLDDKIDNDYEAGQGAYNPDNLRQQEGGGNNGYDSKNGSHDKLDGYDRKSDGLDAREKDFKNPTDSLKDKEGGTNPAWDVNKDSFDDGHKTYATVTITRNAGPAAALFGALIGSSLLITLFVAPASIFVNLKENFTNQFDQQSITSSSRSHRIASKRLTDTETKGACTIIKLACRYNKPSKRFLKNLESSGIKAFKDGKAILPDDQIWGSKTRPDKYVLANGKEIAAKDFYKTMKSDPATRVAFNVAHNPRWVNWVDKTAINFLRKLGLSKLINKTLSTTPDGGKSTQKMVDDTIKGDTLGEDAAKNSVKAETQKFVSRSAKKLAKGDKVLMPLIVACMLRKAPSVVMNVVKAYRLRHLAKLAMVFLTLADAIKAQDATQEQAINAGDMLTKVVSDKSAMDGAIYYGLFGDRGAAKNSKYTSKLLPGAGLDLLGGVIAAIDNKITGTSCAVITSPATQAAVDTGIMASGLGTIPQAILSAINALMAIPIVQEGIGQFTSEIAGLVFDYLISPFVNWEAIMEAILSDDTKGLSGEALGTAVVIGGGLMMASAANAGGNSALTPAQKVAFDNEIANPTRLAWAEEDRLTHSPFDTSNPNTFLGSVMLKLYPYISSANSVWGAFSSINKISLGSSRLLTSPTFADGKESDWQMCDDFSIEISGVAAGPICDVQFGVPYEYMGKDPETVLLELHETNQIDDDGNPVSGSDLQDWINECNNGAPSDLETCIIQDANMANFSLYQIDKRVIDAMDDGPIDPSGKSSSTSAIAPDDTVAKLDDSILDNISTPDVDRVATNYTSSLSDPAKTSLGATPDTSHHLVGSVLELRATSYITGVQNWLEANPSRLSPKHLLSKTWHQSLMVG